MIQKRPLDPRRLRSRPPRGFGWLDHRLLREGYLARCSPAATALYCLLVCAGDAHGLSFYGDPRVCTLLAMEPALLPRVRGELVELGLLAYRKPLYQVLALGGGAAPVRVAASRSLLPAPAHTGNTLDALRALSIPKRLPPPPEIPAPAPAAERGALNLRATVEAALAAARPTGGVE